MKRGTSLQWLLGRCGGTWERTRKGGRPVNLAQLVYFEAVYEKRSYAAAARCIPMSHQGLIKSLSALSSELGVPLFCAAEGSSVVTPTAYADALHGFAADVSAGRAALTAEFERIARAGNTVRLGAATGVLGLLGITFLDSFRAKSPQVDVVEEELADLRCDEGLAQGRFDLALTVLPYDDAFETRPLYEMDRYVWLSRTDRLARAEAVRVEDLAGRHVGAMGPAFKNHGGLVDLAAAHGVEFASLDAAAEMLWLSRYAHNAGRVAFTAKHVAHLFEQDEAIVARRFEGLPWGFGISWCKGHPLSEQESSLVEHCVAHARRLAALGVEGYIAS